MSSLDLSQISLSDLIVAIQYQVGRQMAEAKGVVKVLTESFPDKAHVSKTVKEFQERVDWLADLKESFELFIEKASPRFIKEFKERHALLIAAFQEADYVTPTKPPKPVRGPKKSPNKPCQHCHVSIRPENHTDHEDGCRMNPKNRKDAGTVTTKPNRSEDLKPCRYCKRLLGPKNLGRHENLCPKNPKTKCAYEWCKTNTRKEASDYCKRCNSLLGIKGKPRGKAGKKKVIKKAVKKSESQSSIEARIKDARRKKAESAGALSPHNQKQVSEWDKKHRDGVKKKKVKHARYLCENCGNVEMLLYHGKDTIECPKCKANTFSVIAKLDDKGERVEDFEIEEQANALEEK